MSAPRLLVASAVLVLAGCGTGATTVSASPTSTVAAPTVTVAPEPTGAPATSTRTPDPTAVPVPEAAEPAVFAGSDGTAVDPNAPMIAYWAISETVGNAPSMRYAMKSSNRFPDLYDEQDGILGSAPFGAPPSTDSIVRIWSAGGDMAANPGPDSIYPVECVGTRPDADGDALLDDCDPFPTDGPLADFDDDGVINEIDNCPAMPNPDQYEYGGSSGAACDPDEHDSNPQRILFSTMTVEDMNDRRAGQGLPPIIWPVVDPVLLPDVAAWCELVDAFETSAGIDLDGFDELLAAMPAVYGLDDADKALLRQLSLEEQEIVAAGEFDAAAEERLRAIDRTRRPIVAVLTATDQSCEVMR